MAVAGIVGVFYTSASPCGMSVLLYGPVVNLCIQVHMGFYRDTVLALLRTEPYDTSP